MIKWLTDEEIPHNQQEMSLVLKVLWTRTLEIDSFHPKIGNK